MPDQPPWPMVNECYNRDGEIPDHCHQCDRSHTHDWIAADLPAGDVTRRATRCGMCGARKCDMVCGLRRHHRGQHIQDPAPVGVDELEEWLSV